MPLLHVIFSLQCVSRLKQVLAKISAGLLDEVLFAVMSGHQITLTWRGLQE